MDALSSVLSRIALRAGVFYSGNICGLHDFEHDVFKPSAQARPLLIPNWPRCTPIKAYHPIFAE
jgi:hypothetical protein